MLMHLSIPSLDAVQPYKIILAVEYVLAMRCTNHTTSIVTSIAINDTHVTVTSLPPLNFKRCRSNVSPAVGRWRL